MNDCDEHGHQEVQLSEHSDQVDHLHEGQECAQGEQDLHRVGDLRVLDV